MGLWTTTGCYSIPEGQSAISKVSIEGVATRTFDEGDVGEKLTTRESPRFLGMFEGVVYDYEIFDRYALRRDLARIERYMRARGYYEAKVQVARVVQNGDKVRVTIEVQKGEPVVVDKVEVVGDEGLEEKARRKIERSVARALPVGAALDEEKFAEAEKNVLSTMTARGHANAKVTRHAEVDLATHTARLNFSVEPGLVAHLGPVNFIGLAGVPEEKVRQVFALKEGDLYSSDDIEEAKQALLDLGVFASIDVEADRSAMETTRIVPLTVKTEVSKLRTILLGGGVEFDPLRTDVHGLIGWQSANFLGGLRKFDVRFKPGVVLYPTRLSDDFVLPKKYLVEQRLSASLGQPGFIESRTTGLASGEYSVYPVILPPSQNATPTNTVVGYQELRGTLGAERKFFNHLLLNPSYGAQANFPFDYLGHTEGVSSLVISYLSLFSTLDFRDNPTHTKKGLYIGNQFQYAGGPLQGNASDLRIQPEVRGYLQLSRRVVLAARTSVGFLFPQNYGEAAKRNAQNPATGQLAPDELDALNRDYQILYFRGFFAGGPSSNRGYPIRGIGPYQLIPYLSPAGQSTGATGCSVTNPSCLLPTGGTTLWEASVEARFVVSGPISTALFCDAADVSPYNGDIRLDRPHLSCGIGARYDTPVGPIRLDLGYRIPGLQTPGGDSSEVEPATLFGAPLALSFGIGEAF
ncbi:Outer membrane protein assembly factor YaeT precursor [Labilithrix luteola]|uniref:Outer membrane protein assembly factor YaeT n=1 Tax=Labilithrix luteola TaxID=1391654 RepID=A0A0K1PUN8_9BACT|nr:Outer membrane protein assembly factor YaeT precursor [Labilithrix luteola]